MKNTIPQLGSWIPPSITHSTLSGVFGLEVTISDPGVVQFIVEGCYRIETAGGKSACRLRALLCGFNTLHGQLETAVWDETPLKPNNFSLNNGEVIPAYFWGIFRIPKSQNLLILVRLDVPTSLSCWSPPSLIAEAQNIFSAYQTEITAHEEKFQRKILDNADFIKKHPQLEESSHVNESLWAQEHANEAPRLSAQSLLSFIPYAALFYSSKLVKTSIVERDAIGAVASSGWAPPRDGSYEILFPVDAFSTRCGLIIWTPSSGSPSYPEVRWSVQKVLKGALSKPRLTVPARPDFISGLMKTDDFVTTNGFEFDSSEAMDALDELELDQSDFISKVDEIRKENSEYGFEAFAWFQPYHSWTEESWGIYINARKLDSFALSISEELRKQQVNGAHSLAAMLAFGLTYSHELFHAKVEAALSWLEINTGQPRYLRYQKNVYNVLRETPNWLEEALANWSSWAWYQSDTTRSHIGKRINTFEGLDRVVETLLSLSPPGYRDWKIGAEQTTWRIFSTQMTTAKQKMPAPGIALPIESILTGPLPYEFLSTDIPLRFVESGVIADTLKALPATFNVPGRREIEKALRYFRHILDTSGGKGGHQKWTGPDNRAFILPTRDPLSMIVFKSFLRHFNIDKATYVNSIRPKL
jgi:hypothetical protein